MGLFLEILTKVFFILSPFSSVSNFLMLTAAMDARQRRRCALRTAVAVVAITLIIFYFGTVIFHALGITVAAFQVGAGCLLFLRAVHMVQGKKHDLLPEPGEDFTLVPLATPLIAGPGTIGTLMVFAAHMKTLNERLIGGTAALTAALAISTLLFLAEPIGRVLRQKGLQALMKLTGLVLSAISAQLVFAGVKALLSGVTIGMPGSVGSQ